MYVIKHHGIALPYTMEPLHATQDGDSFVISVFSLPNPITSQRVDCHPAEGVPLQDHDAFMDQSSSDRDSEESDSMSTRS